VLRLRTLGGLSLWRDGERVGGTPAFALEVLAILMLAGDRPVPADDIIALVWPDRPREVAREMLQRLFTALGESLGEQPVREQADGFRLEAAVISGDVRDFEFAAATGAPDEAVKVYGGPFLDMVAPPSASFQRWRERESARLAQHFGWCRDVVRPRRSAVTLAPGTRLGYGGRYRIEGEIGSGGAATVFAGHDARHDRRVAIKVLRQEISETISPERFAQEIKLLAKLQHPNILPLFDSGEIGPTLFSVTPYVEGESVRQRLDRAGRWRAGDAVRLMREVADALAYAHDEGVVHRDVKPENILISNEHALLADFGIARTLATRDSSGGRITLPGMVLGSPWYMSPEQSSGESELDGRSDVYSAAAVLYEMVTGAPPFHGESPRKLMTRRLTEAPPPASSVEPTVPEVVDRVLQRALQPLPDDRASAREFANALASAERALTRSGAIPKPAVPGRLSSVLRSLIAKIGD
jgi:tRNA A-37 threonylcarbamoyl transferase component Bud32